MKRLLVTLAIVGLLANFSSLHTLVVRPVSAADVSAPLTPPATADVAKIDLKSQTSATVGELVEIDASESVAESYTWSLAPDTKDFRVIDGGKRLLFSSRTAVNYTVTLAVAFQGTVDLKIVTVKMAGAPAPDINVPTDFSHRVTELCSLVKSEGAKSEAGRLAASFDQIATFAESGVLDKPTVDQTIEAINLACRKANQDALGSAKDAWLPFFGELSKELSALSSAGKLNDVPSHVTTWRLIAKGLRTHAEA